MTERRLEIQLPTPFLEMIQLDWTYSKRAEAQQVACLCSLHFMNKYFSS